MDITPKEYAELVKQKSKKSPIVKNTVLAFIIGGLICVVGQLIMNGWSAAGLNQEDAGSATSCCLVFLSALFTGLNLYNKLAKYGGAGTLVPITGFANAVVSPAIDFKSEGFVTGMRDETDRSGLKLTIDLKRGTDPDKLIAKLFKQTTLQDTCSCNFNVLIAGMPKVLGVRQLLEEWCAWRRESVKRRVYFVLGKKKDKLHLLKGLKRILLDIDKAIKIIRETAEEAEVIPNLMIGFGIDQTQAEYVAEIKLRNINKEYILKRVQETDALQDEIEDLENLLENPQRVKKVIIDELGEVARKYGQPRRTTLIYSHDYFYNKNFWHYVKACGYARGGRLSDRRAASGPQRFESGAAQ